YAVFHVAIGQLLAAPAIALITWAGVALWRGQLTVRRVTAFAGVLAVAYALIWGSYNFIVVVCLVPAVALAGGVAWWRREWSRFAGWSVAMLAPLAACGVVFWTRVDGLAERFLLFRATDFGWRVPVLTSEGWLGWVGDYQLNALAGSARWILLALFSGAFVATVAWAWRWRRDVGYVAVCLTIPPLMGYAFLQVRGAVLGTNASYDAYKILAVFFPGILAAAAWPVARGLQARGVMRTGAVALLGLITIGHVRAVGLYFERMKLAPFGVTRELVQLRRLEQQPEISSVNMLITDGWSRLWANAHLLRIPQFFDTHTYEGRLNTPLRGRWDLVGGVLDLSLPDAGSRRLGPHYSLLDTKSPWFLRARFGAGWFDLEQLVSSPEQWRWSRREGSVRLENPQPYSLRADLELRARAIAPTTLEVWINGVLWTTVKVGIAPAEMRVSGLALPPGESVVVFRTATGTNSTEADPRELGCAFYRIAFHVMAHSAGVR
ncbi:MAG TPA: hypothetical protein VEQ65_02890, partial [Opitutus sp.]|nr:hypothetical protein [Opitutus sp.]